MTETHELEDLAETNTTQVLDLITAGDREGLSAFVTGRTRKELAWMVLSLGNALIMQDSAVDGLHLRVGVLTGQNATLDSANAQLFEEKRALIARVEELRGILNGRAARAPKTKASDAG